MATEAERQLAQRCFLVHTTLQGTRRVHKGRQDRPKVPTVTELKWYFNRYFAYCKDTGRCTARPAVGLQARTKQGKKGCF